MIEVVLVDDHTIVRQGIKLVLSEHDDIVVVAEANDSTELFAALKANNADAIVLDISLPGRSGIDILKQLKVSYAHIPVLVLSMYPAEQYALRVMQAGAFGYLTKESASDELVRAIRQLATGSKYISTDLALELANFVDPKHKGAKYQELTDRELEVLQKIARGMTLTEIGEELSLSIKTISTYKSRLMNKLGIHSNSDLIRYAVDNKLV